MEFADPDEVNPNDIDDVEPDQEDPADTTGDPAEAVDDQDLDEDEAEEADDFDDEDDEDDRDEQPAPDNASAELEELVKFIASRLVHEADEIEVESEFRGGTVYISLRVPESEMGRVIGREGRTAKAIRTLVSIAGSRYNVHARLDIDG
jgi:predicted RNA-binding protein YlqC (UPF0109 family)